MKNTNFIIVHGCNGEGYSAPTIKRVKTLNEAIKYAHGLFTDNYEVQQPTDRELMFDRTGMDFGLGAKNSFAFFRTDADEDTERVEIFPVKDESICLVSIDANVNGFKVAEYSSMSTAKNMLKKESSIIKAEEREKYKAEQDESGKSMAGDGEDGYHHFKII